VFILGFNDNLVYINVACLNKEISNISTALLLTLAFEVNMSLTLRQIGCTDNRTGKFLAVVFPDPWQF